MSAFKELPATWRKHVSQQIIEIKCRGISMMTSQAQGVEDPKRGSGRPCLRKSSTNVYCIPGHVEHGGTDD